MSTGHQTRGPTDTGVVIIGAGFSGMGAAIKLDAAGRRDWVIIEAADEVGGTWRDNIYPGAACDVPSHLYSYSFEPWDWTRAYAGQREIQTYAVHVSRRYGLRGRIRFRRRVTRARWVEADRRWEITCDTGEVFRAPATIGAIGGLRDPKWPAIEGRTDFAGPMMHSARWDPGVPLEGKRVGIIGTGASAIQLAPAIAQRAASVHVFQRTPPWLVPRGNKPYSAWRRGMFRRLPVAQRLHRARLYLRQELMYLAFGPLRKQLNGVATKVSRDHLHSRVADPDLRRRLQPDYAIGCKRILVDDAYYDAVGGGHVQLEDTGIERITPTGVRMAGGREITVDVLVFATGFTIDRPLGELDVVGRGGASLADEWGRRPRAYLGMTMPGFPNFFMMVGPNSGLGHNSVIFIIESELRYILSALRFIHRHDAVVELRPSAMTDWQAEVDRRTSSTVWQSGCRSWYLNEEGENFTLWPGSTIEYLWRTRRFDPAPYRCEHATGATPHTPYAYATALD